MNIRKRYMMIAAIAVMSVVSVACAMNENAVFNGSKTGAENHFDIDFEMLNAAYEHKLVMEEGGRALRFLFRKNQEKFPYLYSKNLMTLYVREMMYRMESLRWLSVRPEHIRLVLPVKRRKDM